MITQNVKVQKGFALHMLGCRLHLHLLRVGRLVV